MSRTYLKSFEGPVSGQLVHQQILFGAQILTQLDAMTTISMWLSSCLIGVCLMDMRNSGFLVSSEIPELDEFDAQDQKAFSPDIVLKSSPLYVHHSPDEAVRQPLVARIANRQQKSARTATKLPSTNFPPSEELDEENGMSFAEEERSSVNEGDGAEAAPAFSSTEIPRKKLTGSTRPFRSQQDLVESLKRRRQMIQQHEYTSSPTTLSTTTTSERTQSKRKYGNTNKSPRVSESNGFEKNKQTSNRRYGTQAPTEEAMTEESNVISQPAAKSGRMYSNGRRPRN